MTNSLFNAVNNNFYEAFGQRPSHITQAPGRVNLIGEHTDYNDGFALPCAINYQTLVAVRKREDRQVRVVAMDYGGESDQFSQLEPITPQAQPWKNYVRGVIKQLLDSGHTFGGLDMAIGGNIPQGAGLSSSASLEVAVGHGINETYQLGIDLKAIALNGQAAENQFVGCQCGNMDQLICARAVSGSASLLDCRHLTLTPVNIPISHTVVIIDSNVKRQLVGSEYDTRRKQCELAARTMQVPALRDADLRLLEKHQHHLSRAVLKRAKHVITENARTLSAAEAFRTNDIPAIARLMAQSHQSMREDFEITVPQINALVNIVSNALSGRGGVRMTGGGFGGCVVALAPRDAVPELLTEIDAQYPRHTGLNANTFVCEPAAGVGAVSVEC